MKPVGHLVHARAANESGAGRRSVISTERATPETDMALVHTGAISEVGVCIFACIGLRDDRTA